MTRRRSVIVLAIAWCASVAVMLVRGRTDGVTIGTDVVFLLAVALLAWLTVRLVPAAP